MAIYLCQFQLTVIPNEFRFFGEKWRDTNTFGHIYKINQSFGLISSVWFNAQLTKQHFESGTFKL